MHLSQYPNSDHSRKKILPILITIMFFLITSYMAAFHHNYWILDHDGQIYLDVGKQILSGNGENVKLHNALVGGPVFYAFVDQFFNNGFGVMKAIAVLSATGSVFFSYYIINNLFNRKVALIGQLFFAFNPWLGFFSFQAENELLPILFISISLYLITKKELKSLDIILIGFFLGLATSIRLQALIVLLTAFLYTLFYFKQPRKISYHFVLLSLAFLITLSPVILYNYTTHESPFDTNAAWSMQFHNKYQYPEWSEKMHEITYRNLNRSYHVIYCSNIEPDRKWSFPKGKYKKTILNSKPIKLGGTYTYLWSNGDFKNRQPIKFRNLYCEKKLIYFNKKKIG